MSVTFLVLCALALLSLFTALSAPDDESVHLLTFISALLVVAAAMVEIP